VNASVIVCGSLNMDLVARVDHLPRPGETVVGASLQRLPGGKGLNQAVAAARMGAAVAMIGARGDDADGAALAALLASEGIDTRDLRVRDPRAMPDAHTGLAQVTVAADGENSIVVHGGANLSLTAEEVRAAFAVPSSATSGQEASSPTEPPQAGPPQVAPVRVALAQLETPLVAVSAFFEAARDAGVRTILNPAPAVADALPLLADVDLVVLNETELAIFSAAVAREAGADGIRFARPVDAALSGRDRHARRRGRLARHRRGCGALPGTGGHGGRYDRRRRLFLRGPRRRSRARSRSRGGDRTRRCGGEPLGDAIRGGACHASGVGTRGLLKNHSCR
jgi:sugar/nucleoside kinase (ribokinase family)